MEIKTNIETKGRSFYCKLREVNLNDSTKHHGALTDTMIVVWK